MKPTQRLHNLGQSLWLDNITRALLDDGTLQRYIDELSVTGLTSNPSIFNEAIGGGWYDASIGEKARAGLAGEALFIALALEDLRRAADLFRPIHARSGGVDGWVSMEVSPLLAIDAVGTIAAAKDIFAAAGRPNLFVKIPGTPEGAVAIEEAIFAGIPVNVTLLFSRDQYLAAAQAYVRGIERRIAAGLDPVVESVASVFVSRWDRALGAEVPAELHGRLGIAIAARTYRAYRELFSSADWQRLAQRGAHPQRLLWASTSNKGTALPSCFYVEALALPGTVDALPEQTLLAFANEGKPGVAMAADDAEAQALLVRFARAGVDIDALALKLQIDGTKAFVDAWNELMRRIATKSAALAAA